MQRIAEMMTARAAALLADGTVQRVLGWEKGDFDYDLTPAFFETADELKNLVYGDYSGANLSKYLIKAGKKEGRTLVFLKPCDTLSMNQLMAEHRVDREKVYVIGVGCKGMLDHEKVEAAEAKGEKKERLELMLGKCQDCKGKTFAVSDEVIDDEESRVEFGGNRFSKVAELEAMTPEERFAFWQSQLSKCIRCNACRNVCPACSCNKCVFDNANSGVSAKVNANEFEERMFHIIRAFHVAGRCTDCGECSRVCPQNIPLHLLNRKFIKDIDEIYGDYQAGESVNERHPLINYTKTDAEPSIVYERGGRE